MQHERGACCSCGFPPEAIAAATGSPQPSTRQQTGMSAPRVRGVVLPRKCSGGEEMRRFGSRKDHLENGPNRFQVARLNWSAVLPDIFRACLGRGGGGIRSFV